MKKSLSIFAILLSLTACKDTKSVEGTKQEGCFVSDKLRVKIGETVFAFPRGDIQSMGGPDTQWVGEPVYSKKVKAEKVCQKETSAPLKINYLGLKPNIEPTLCLDKCQSYSRHGTRLFGSITKVSDLKKYTNHVRLSASDHILECKEKSYFNTCKHFVEYKDIRFGFQYYLESYPLEDIENTEKHILEYLKSHEFISNIISNQE